MPILHDLQTMQTRSLRDDANGTGNGGMGLAVVKGNGGEDKKGGEDGFWRQYGLKYWGKFISIAWGSVFLRAWAQILRACREFANTFWVTSASLVATLMFEHMTGGISRVIDQFKGNVMGEKGNQSGKIEIKGLNNEEIQSIRIALETVATEMKKMRDRGDQNLLGRILAAPKEITAAEKTKEAVKVN